MHEISIVIPSYNECLSIKDTIFQIDTLLKKNKFVFEIIVVDDCSTDNTYELIRNLSVKIIRHNYNKGYGASLKTGIKASEYKSVLIIDADNTYPIDKIPDILNSYFDEGFDMVVGARIGKNVSVPFSKKLAKWLIVKLANYVTKRKIPDINSGLRVIKKELVIKYLNILPDGFSFTSTITIALLSNNHDVNYLPIDYHDRKGHSKIRPVYDFLNFILLIIRTTVFFNPLKIYLTLSLILSLIGFFVLFGSYLFTEKIMDVTFGICLIGSIMIASIGILADLIVKKSN
ncbi:MAG: glycosyl transferase family 2 [uncultured bacterium]|nr:MAG: glycosyl transferase family 2 [uncultured bacterium]